ncbi:MAG TPA: hypothetical protein VGK73_05555 [Polyangiaceae bacterium]
MSTISRQEVRAHIEAKLRAATLDLSPLPHIIIEDFFPADVYCSILDYNLFQFNAGREWISKNMRRLRRLTTPYDHRKQINFHSGEPYTSPPEAKAFWDEMQSVFLGDSWFPKLVYEKFPTYFQLRFGDAADGEDLWQKLRTELFLQRHEPDYYIGPHTDISTRVFTCIFSFADRPGFEEFGTQLLRHKEPMTRCWGDKHYGFDDFETVKLAPYKPNNFLLFFKTRHSFHAVKTVSREVPNQRYGMQFQLYEPHGGVFRDLSRPNLMRVQYENWLGKLAGPVRSVVRTIAR